MKEEALRNSHESLKRPLMLLFCLFLLLGTIELTECASGGWAHGHGGCFWQVQAWRPESAASFPRSPQPSDPGCNRASSYPRPAHRSSPDVWARHYLDNHRGTFYIYKLRRQYSAHDSLMTGASLTRNSWHHGKVWHLIIKSLAKTVHKTVHDFASTFKQTFGVLLVKSEQLSGSFANLGQGELDPPHLTLVPQSILALKYAKIKSNFCDIATKCI